MNRKIFLVIVPLFCVFSLFAQDIDNDTVNVTIVYKLFNSVAERHKGLISYQVDDPMILIDGVESSKDVLARLNIDDIKSFSILREASAVAIYGTRGANGVILITTKLGSKDLIEPKIVETENPSEPDLIVDENNSVDYENVTIVPLVSKASDLRLPAPKISEALAGRIPGLISYQAVDQPKEFIINCGCPSSRVDPLILIDGVELTPDDLKLLMPDDIKEFSILKDSKAVETYGARGANGVIIVTTKLGSKNLTKTDTADISETENPFPDLKIYPNPFAGTLHLAGAEGSTLQVTTEDGAVVHTQKLVNPVETILLEHLRPGVYVFCVNNGKQTRTVKAVKN